jgi:photosystem II stability/assembly factor-like uncharacterized protein
VGTSIYNRAIWVNSDAGLTDTAITALHAKGTLLFAGTGSGVYRTSDSGAHWTRAGEGLPAAAVTSLAGVGRYLFAGTDAGLYRSEGNGEHWVAVME